MIFVQIVRKEYTLDKKWEFHKSKRELFEIENENQEKERKKRGEKYHCSSCQAEISVTPGRTFDHHGWAYPIIQCGAYEIRQLEYQKQEEILYVCQQCCLEAMFAEHLSIEKLFHIPRP